MDFGTAQRGQSSPQETHDIIAKMAHNLPEDAEDVNACIE
jgi:hypothetical protein